MTVAEAHSEQQRKPQSFQHILLTRFNVRYVEDPNAASIGVDPAWLAPRFELFERYCLPSILAQTNQNFIWIIFFDSATPEPFLSRARNLARGRPRIVPVFTSTVPLDLAIGKIKEALTVEPEWILTTRVDNDDGIGPEFVSTVQNAQRFAQSEVLNCPVGLIARNGRTYRRRDASNAFISLSEPYAGFRSVFSILRHHNAHEAYPVRQLIEVPLWLQVVHESNVSNRVRGWRVPATEMTANFPFLPATPPPAGENTGTILAENLTMSFVRSSRDLAVGVARQGAKLFGVELRRKVAPAATREQAS